MPNPLHSSASGTDLHEDKRIKEPVRAASTANVSTSAPGATLDGITLVSGDRILLKNQSTDSQNGIYVWTGAAVAITRSADADANADFVFGFQVYVREGSTNGTTIWKYTQSSAVTLGSTSITFGNVGAGGSGTVTSVALTAPGEFTVSGSPVTTTGTLVLNKANESANTVWAGPTSGGAAVPAFRAIVPADVPTMVASGGSHAAGLAPDPGASSGSTKFLREDATWQVPAGAGSGNGARLRNSTNQSCTSGVARIVNWNTEDADTASMHGTLSGSLTGTVATTAGSPTLTGTSTLFTTELYVGAVVQVLSTVETKVITAITDNTHATASANWANNTSGSTASIDNSQVTFLTAGTYGITLGAYMAAVSTGTVVLAIVLNGTTTIAEAGLPSVNASNGYNLACNPRFAQWDYIYATVLQSSGGAVNLLADQRTHLEINI